MSDRAALRRIRDTEGRVCDEYEVCTHRACQSSYAAWATADEALAVPRTRAWLTRTRPQPYWSLICFAVLVAKGLYDIASAVLA